MPVSTSRPNWSQQLERLSYSKGVKIREEVMEFLSKNSKYGFKADEIVARIDVSASAAMVESVLSHHPEEVNHTIFNGDVYWYL